MIRMGAENYFGSHGTIVLLCIWYLDITRYFGKAISDGIDSQHKPTGYSEVVKDRRETASNWNQADEQPIRGLFVLEPSANQLKDLSRG